MITRSFFKYCKDKQYPPNQLFMLFCIKHNIVCPIKKINQDYEIRELIHNELLDADGRSITTKGMSVLNHILKVVEKKPELKVDEDFAQKYLNIFPKMVLPSNKPARVSLKIILKQLGWFFNTYPQYDMDLVLRATTYYVRKFEEQDYKFMRNSQYFISKETTNRMISSSLAEFCQLILDGVDDETNNVNFTTKVV